MYWVGKAFGSLLQIVLSDRWGRRNLLVAGSFVLFLSLIINLFAQTYYQITFVRFLYGVTNGTLVTLSLLLMVEITPLKVRGRG